jgi:hypothetical protein
MTYAIACVELCWLEVLIALLLGGALNGLAR